MTMTTTRIKEVELQALRDVRTETEWNLICDQIKAARDGRYPSDWVQAVLLTGLMSDVMDRCLNEA